MVHACYIIDTKGTFLLYLKLKVLHTMQLLIDETVISPKGVPFSHWPIRNKSHPTSDARHSDTSTPFGAPMILQVDSHSWTGQS